MKILTSYTLNINDNTIDLSNEANFDIKRLQKITNVSKDNKVIYDINKKDLGYSTVIDGIVTLKYDISAFSLGDKLRIEYSEGDSYATSSDINLVVSAIKTNKNFDQTIWWDSTNGYYLLQSVVNTTTGDITNTYIKPDGTPVTPAIDAKVFQYVNNQATINREYRALITNNTKGFISGDRIAQTEIYNITNSPATLQETIWKNLTSNSVITPAPSIGTEVDILDALENQETTQQQVKAVLDNLKTNSDTLNLKDFATAAKQDAAKAVFDDINANLGAKTDSVASTDTGTFSLISLVKKGLVSLSSLVGVDFSTAAKQDAAKGVLDNLKTNSDTLNSKDFATSANQTTANTKLDTINTSIGTTNTNTSNLYNLHNNQQTTGTLTGTGSVTFSNITGKKPCAVITTVPSSMVNCVGVFEYSFDNTNWFGTGYLQVAGGNPGYYLAAGTSTSLYTSGLGSYVCEIFGATYFRYRCTTFSGTSMAFTITAVDNQLLTHNVPSQYGIDGNKVIPSLGQTTMASSLPVAIASNQSNLPINIAQLVGSTPAYSLGYSQAGNAGPLFPTYSHANISPSSITSIDVKTTGTFDLTGNNSAYFSADLNITALSGGSSPTIDFVIQESFDSGTTYVDIWHCERISATGRVKIPPMASMGYKRLAWTTSGSPTTATLTRSYQGHSATFPIRRQFFDRTTNLLNGTLNATSSSYNISGCQIINGQFTCGTITSGVAAYYQLQVSYDNSNWESVGTAVQAVASSSVKLTASIDGSYNFARIICQTGATGTQNGTFGLISGKGI